MKKTVRKLLSLLFPKGKGKEKLKLLFYRLTSKKNVEFDVRLTSGQTIYFTKVDGVELVTNEALYHVVDDFRYYGHFYNVSRNDVVLDAGANCGHLSLFYANKVGDKGTVYAFEPDQFNIKRINDNIKLNLHAQNIIIEELLLWDKNEWVDFYEAGTVGSSAHWKPDDSLLVQKQAMTIDSWVESQKLQQLNFIKMDIEGAEIEALLGCRNTINKFQPHFAIASYHVVNGEQTYLKLEQFFESIGYPYKTITFKPGEIITFAGKGIN